MVPSLVLLSKGIRFFSQVIGVHVKPIIDLPCRGFTVYAKYVRTWWNLSWTTHFLKIGSKHGKKLTLDLAIWWWSYLNFSSLLKEEKQGCGGVTARRKECRSRGSNSHALSTVAVTVVHHYCSFHVRLRFHLHGEGWVV